MRRSALLLAAPVLAAGLLAGCDLPGGSPRVLGPDQVPNNEPPGADVTVPSAINGSVDSNDTVDFFTLRAPSGDTAATLTITCTGDVTVQVDTGGLQASQIGEPVYCNGSQNTFYVPAGERPLVEVLWNENQQFTPYFLSVSYSPVTETTSTVIG